MISEDIVQLLREHGKMRCVARGEILVAEGENSESLFVLLTGKLKVFTRDDRTREVIYNTLHPGEIVGEMILDGGVRSASVKALTDAECLEITASQVRDLIRSCPELSEFLVFKLIGRLRRATIQIRSLALDNVSARTVAAIDELAETRAGTRFLPMTVSQQHIASRIGATREMVNHVFRDLVRGGILMREKQLGFVIAKPLPKQE